MTRDVKKQYKGSIVLIDRKSNLDAAFNIRQVAIGIRT
jgi:hypothetical protein